MKHKYLQRLVMVALLGLVLAGVWLTTAPPWLSHTPSQQIAAAQLSGLRGRHVAARGGAVRYIEEWAILADADDVQPLVQIGGTLALTVAPTLWPTLQPGEISA